MQEVRSLTHSRVLALLSCVIGGAMLGTLDSPVLQGQQALRDLIGTVQDGHHEPVRGAVVYLENEATHSVMTYITDRSGRFSFKRIQTDVDYDVWAIYRGRDSKRKSLSQFDTHPSPSLTLVVKPE